MLLHTIAMSIIIYFKTMDAATWITEPVEDSGFKKVGLLISNQINNPLVLIDGYSYSLFLRQIFPK